MFSHPDPEVNTLITLIEGQRDAAMLNAGQNASAIARLTAENEQLKAQLAQATAALEAFQKPSNVVDLPQGDAAA